MTGPFTVTQDTLLTLSAAQLVGNDTDPDKPYGDTLAVASAGFATGGAARLNPDGTVTFTPTTNYAGPASFTYRVKDTAGATSATSTKVTPTVVAINQAPTAVNDGGFTIAEDTVLTLAAAQLVGNDTDPNPGDSLGRRGGQRFNGTVALTGDGSVKFTPPPTTTAPPPSPTPSKTPPASHQRQPCHRRHHRHPGQRHPDRGR